MGSNRSTTNVTLLPTSTLLPLALLVLLVPQVVLGRARGVKAVGEDEDKKKLLEEVVAAVEKTLGFFSEDYSSINVDGLFGIRVAQGQLLEALRECQSDGSCPEALRHRLQVMVDAIERAAGAAMSYVKEEDVDYYQRFIQVIDRPFRLPDRQKTLHDLATTPVGSDADYDEETGDGCMSRIMGTYKEERTGKVVDECNVTKSCWDMMTEEGKCRYSITHQLIYFSFIEKQGCTETVETSMKAKVAETQERMCRSIYNEAVTEVMDDKVADIFQDLFLEQVLVCGTLGFENFMRADWMRMVLRWQKPSGCFSVDDPVVLETEKQLVKAQEQERKLMKDLKLEARLMEQRGHNGRKLLRERVMQGGCLSHKSGLAFGTLSVFTRYLIGQNFAQ